MIHISSKTAAILAAFTAVSAPLMMAGCGQEQVKGDTLTDENGRKYQLIKNEDGTETAKYENGEEVTFRRDENDNLNYVSGMSSLLPMMMMSYFLFHGLGGYHGTYDRSTGNVLNNNKPAYTQTQQTGGAANQNAANKSGTTVQQGTAGGNKSTVTAPAGGKTGFGSAGVRSGGAS